VKVAVINYGMGNLGSVRRALEELGIDVVVAKQPELLADANRVVLPGVGAFGEGMQRLRAGGWIDVLQRQVIDGGKPMLGICLGMEMLASSSEENGFHDGLNFIPGQVLRLDKLGCSDRIPHVGWNDVSYRAGTPLFAGIPQAMDFYFVHSYAFEPDDPADVDATTVYGVTLTATVRKGHVFGTQFHPEKSSKAGRQILKNFLEYVPC
jgi:imidazole glycerol-phosphate synthase subunit HisH